LAAGTMTILAPDARTSPCLTYGPSTVLAAVRRELLVLDVWMTGAYSTATLALLARLRSRAAPETRGFRVPGGKVGAWLVVIVPAATWVMVLCATAREHWIEGVSALLIGSLIYMIMTRIRRRSARGLEAPTG